MRLTVGSILKRMTRRTNLNVNQQCGVYHRLPLHAPSPLSSCPLLSVSGEADKSTRFCLGLRQSITSVCHHPSRSMPRLAMRSPTPRGSDSSDEDEQDNWPTSTQTMATARAFIQECAAARLPTLLLPDKDADGLCSALILHHTLTALGLPPALIHTHFVAKGANVHAPAERARLKELVPRPRFVLVADQGSRAGPAILPGEGEEEEARTLIVDHHLAEGFPQGATVLSAARCDPVATSSTLAYLLCEPLVRGVASKEVRERMEWLCVLGTMGDLGAGHKWERPWPDMSACARRWTKKALGEAVALVNAPRRTAQYDVRTAWEALLACGPAQIVSGASGNMHIRRLHEARVEIRTETERCGHTAPTFSGDGRVALVRIQSEAQVHPLIATRWASTLKSARLQIVICGNGAYLPGAGMTNFACRIARCALPSPAAKGTSSSSKRKSVGTGNEDKCGERAGGEINIPDILREYASRVSGLTESMGEDFARGHAQASGGIVKDEDFERLWQVMRDSQADDSGPPRKRKKIETVQMNTLEGWIKRRE
ncbi:uncharacterized protein B0H18DRAFT_929856 [Fomitopsis serialis]|uniref:uncharacterized protein n=1 Tax=Fomitopsis serialis TaxID=139415 RepID=UPI00200738B6|nr:uncharacterized protein B0H18DRAFT_929856 [Neoantrodia serialis]KAH9931374.1 hypothetical protein B0H18DRAFT_929856 [Neoantrodia serialis]